MTSQYQVVGLMRRGHASLAVTTAAAVLSGDMGSVGKDVNLSKFTWRVHGESMRRAGFTSRLEELRLIEPVVWVLEHLDRTFGTSIVREINLEGGVIEEHLTSARASGGRLRQWKGTMRQRLQYKDR